MPASCHKTRWCQRSCFILGLGIQWCWLDQWDRRGLRSEWGAGTWPSEQWQSSWPPKLVPSAHPDQKYSDAAQWTPEQDPRWAGTTFEVTCPLMRGQGKPRKQVHYLGHSGDMQGGDGTVSLKRGKSTDREFELWIDWTFIKRETILSHRVT